MRNIKNSCDVITRKLEAYSGDNDVDLRIIKVDITEINYEVLD
jgi:hypothetical protein